LVQNRFENSVINSSSLEDLVLSMPMPAHIKDAVTGKYILSNKKNLEIFRLKKLEDILGKTIHDLDKCMLPHWGHAFSKKVSDIDQCVKQKNKKMHSGDHLFVARNGFVYIHDMTKIPITNNNKVTAIFTYTCNKTDNIDLLTLFKIYKNIYSKPGEASKIFCHYLNIDKLLSSPLSCAELTLLLSAKDCNSRNDLANKICRSIKTVETHITHINNKVVVGDFFDTLDMIRCFEKSKEINMENFYGNKKNNFNWILG